MPWQENTRRYCVLFVFPLSYGLGSLFTHHYLASTLGSNFSVLSAFKNLGCFGEKRITTANIVSLFIAYDVPEIIISFQMKLLLK